MLYTVIDRHHQNNYNEPLELQVCLNLANSLRLSDTSHDIHRYIIRPVTVSKVAVGECRTCCNRNIEITSHDKLVFHMQGTQQTCLGSLTPASNVKSILRCDACYETLIEYHTHVCRMPGVSQYLIANSIVHRSMR